jgi:hypothetical protein
VTAHQPAGLAVLDRAGRLLSRFGTAEPTAPGSFMAPHGLAMDSHGGIYVAEVTFTVGVKAGLVPDTCHTFQKFVPKPG